MTSEVSWQIKTIARVLVLGILSSAAYAAPQNSPIAAADQASEEKLPDSPGAFQAQSGQNPIQPTSNQQPSASAPASVGSQPESTPPENDRTLAQASDPNAEEQAPQQSHEPLGTAAAESIPTMGVAASRPAGAAIAPAKQRRVRTILIRVGAVVGVAAAVGATVALSEGSPSRPPGAH